MMGTGQEARGPIQQKTYSFDTQRGCQSPQPNSWTCRIETERLYLRGTLA